MKEHDMPPLDSIDEVEKIAPELTETVAALRALPKEASPSRDLWPEIQARIRATKQASVPLSISGPIDTAHKTWWNRSVSAPWALAASVVLASAIGFATWEVAQRGAPSIAEAGETIGSETIRAVATNASSDLDLPEYDLAVTGLQQAYEAGKERLAPETIEVLEQSLAAIDIAIAEARAAIEADPALDEVRRILYNNLNRKLDVLRQAAEAVQEQA